MTISIKGQSYTEPISVTVNDFCDHAGAEIEMLEYSKPSWWEDAHIYVDDDSELLPTLVCRCGYEELQERDYDSDEY